MHTWLLATRAKKQTHRRLRLCFAPGPKKHSFKLPIGIHSVFLFFFGGRGGEVTARVFVLLGGSLCRGFSSNEAHPPGVGGEGPHRLHGEQTRGGPARVEAKRWVGGGSLKKVPRGMRCLTGRDLL